MRKTALFILTMTFSAGAYAAELNTLCAASLKADFTGEVPVPSIARVYSRPTWVPPACSRVGEDVRIPEECCSKNAVPNQGGEMTCVEAVPAGSTCARIGDDVRIPEECCSKNAVPNQNGEMTCVENAPAAPVQPATPVVTPGCSKVGEDVRIPDECCSRNAEPNQNGEMTCVEAVPAGSSCSKIGEAVRIPEECCSGNAVPAYGGEMECAEAKGAFPMKSPFSR